jgi:hypothetical protein
VKICFLSLLLLIGEASRSFGGQVPFETSNKRHYTDLTARQEINRLYRKVKAVYAFDRLAQTYSQDYGSYGAGGKPGWQKSDQFVPAFYEVIGQLSKTHVSKPFKTEFGYHIVQLLDMAKGEVLTRHILLRVPHH